MIVYLDIVEFKKLFRSKLMDYVFGKFVGVLWLQSEIKIKRQAFSRESITWNLSTWLQAEPCNHPQCQCGDQCGWFHLLIWHPCCLEEYFIFRYGIWRMFIVVDRIMASQNVYILIPRSYQQSTKSPYTYIYSI